MAVLLFTSHTLCTCSKQNNLFKQAINKNRDVEEGVEDVFYA